MEIETDGEVIIPDVLYGDAGIGFRGKGTFEVHPACRPKLAKAKKNDILWVLQDWNTEKYLRLPDSRKGESGDAWLVGSKRDCTVFASLDAANHVALEIERMFWKPAYEAMNLRVSRY